MAADYINLQVAARECGVSLRTIWNWIKRGEATMIKRDGNVFVHRDSVQMHPVLPRAQRGGRPKAMGP